ncbi:AsmA family protein [Maricurvus nonylphenolicus]|uniref:AsmA family protein n=1 Tax=Maricurvus nonylphenolicus TaxID=1008307 RepID=UPI0036F26F30
MSRLIKALAITVGTLVVLVVLAVVFITQWVDPNDHKPELQRLAAAQGIDLQIDGELGWQFFPTLGVTLSDTRIASLQFPNKPVAILAHVSVAVEVMPLLQRQLKVAAVDIDGAVIDLQTDLQARNNWDIASPAADSSKTTPTPSTSASSVPAGDDSASSALDLAVEKIALRNVSLNYQNFRSGDKAALKDLALELQGVNLQGQLFPLTLSTQLHQVKDVPPVTIQLSGSLGFDRQRLDLQPLWVNIAALEQAELDPLALTFEGNINLADETPAVDLQLALQSFNAREWLALLKQLPETTDAKALTKVAATTRIQGQGESILLSPLAVTLDDSAVTGKLSLNQEQQLPLVVELAVDQLNVDRYLPPPQEPAAQKAGATDAKPKAAARYSAKPQEQKLPLDQLRQAKLKFSLAAGKLQVANAKLQNLKLQVRSNLGVAYLDELVFDSYDGRVEANGHLDGRRSEARMELVGSAKGVELLGLLTDTLQEQRLQGAVSTTLKATSRGSTVEQLQRQLSADINLQAQALQVNELDIEQDLCNLAASLGGSSVQGQVWKGYTHLQDVQGQFALRDEQLNISQLTAGVEELSVTARGGVSLQDLSFDIPLDVQVTGQRDENLACQIRDRWRNQDLPLRCRGSLDTIGARTCLPDKERLGDLLEDEAKQELQDKLNKKLREKLGDQGGEAVEGLLRGIFGR